MASDRQTASHSPPSIIANNRTNMKLLKATLLALLTAQATANDHRETQALNVVGGNVNVITPIVQGAGSTVPEYTVDQCDAWLEQAKAADSDESGGLTTDEYYTFLASIDNPPRVEEYFDSAAEGYAALDFAFKITHKALACQCSKLGMGVDCCKGANAEIPISEVMSADMSAPAREFRNDVCNSISATLGVVVPEDTTTTTTTVAATTAATTAAPATTEASAETTEAPAETTEAPAETTEAPAATTEAPLATTEAPAETTEAPPATTEAPPADPRNINLNVIGSVLDYSGVLDGTNDGVPDSYNAQEIMDNFEDNDILGHVITGFGALANTLLDGLDDATKEGKKRTTLTTTGNRELASLEPVMVTDVACPSNLSYAPQDAKCLNFKFVILPASMLENQVALFSDKLRESIDNAGMLYDSVKKNRPDTLITGLGSPGRGIDYLTGLEPPPATTTEAPPPAAPRNVELDILGSVLDYSSFDYSPMLSGKNDGLPEFYNAQEIMENLEDNDILSHLIKGFGTLANVVLDELDDVTEEGKKRGLRAGKRNLASLEPVVVTNVACPSDVVYAPPDAYCLNFHVEVNPASMLAPQVAVFSEKMKWAVDNAGLLYGTIKRDFPETLITGLGSPGNGIDYLNGLESFDDPSILSSESEATDESSGLGTAAIVFIILAVIALPIAIVAMYSRYKTVQNDERLERVREYNASQKSRNDIEAQPETSAPPAGRSSVPTTITAVPEEDDEDSVWSDDREVAVKGSKAGSSLAAMGAAGLGASFANRNGSNADVRAEVEQLIKDTNAPKTADEMLASYAGREDELINNLRKMRAMQQTTDQKAATRAEVESLVQETNAPKSADELLKTYEGRENELINNLKKMKEKQDSDAQLAEIRAEVTTLVEETGAPKSADEMLASYAGREQELLKNLRKMKSTSVRAEVEGLVKDTNSPKSADELLASYVGREDELVKNLKKMKAKMGRMSSKSVNAPTEFVAALDVVAPVDGNAAIKAEISSLVEATNPGKSAADMLAAYYGREEELLDNLQKMKSKQEKAAAKAAARKRADEAAAAAPAPAPLAAQPVNGTDDALRKEVESLVASTKPGKSAADLLAAYEGREQELVAHLQKLKSSASQIV